jgi:hypothetical protein
MIKDNKDKAFEDSAFGPGMMFGIPGPGPKRDTKGIPSDPKKEKGIHIKTKKKMKNILSLEDFVNEGLPTKEIDPAKFPNPGQRNDKDFFIKGKKDGDNSDDVVATKDAAIPAKSLKPSQDAVYLGKALGLAIGGVEGGDLGAIISKDNRILDGHHRWAATMFTNPNAKIIGAKADLGIGDLVPVLRQAGDAMGNERGTMPKGGDVNIFQATMKDVEDCIYRGINMDPKYFDKQKAIAWYEKNKENVERGLKMIQREGPPPGAPPRQEMPKIEPEQVDKVAKDLSAGKIDVREPYNESYELKNLQSYDDFIFESELNELKLTSAGMKDLLAAIYYNWDNIKKTLGDEYYFRSFRDVIDYLKSGDQEEQTELENIVKRMGIEVIDFDKKRTWDR